MGRRKKTDWFEEACAHVVGEIAKGVGKRLRTALEKPPAPKLPLAAQGPYQDAKPAVAPPTINVFQGPTQVVVKRGQKSEVRGQKKGRKPRASKPESRNSNADAVDVEFKVKP